MTWKNSMLVWYCIGHFRCTVTYRDSMPSLLAEVSAGRERDVRHISVAHAWPESSETQDICNHKALLYTVADCFTSFLTHSHPEALLWQSKITKDPVFGSSFDLGGKGLRKKNGQIGLVNPFPPRGSPLKSKIVWR